ncbi:hypothetical protein ORI20_11580 [Mycobacterium sp. CVI_P3]|uniref:Uncharacterized protein n=1 Tax=Mycobacterium pinniadriaticum TaxID=2994102 RepID=A0ABT3SCW8_9MYCO|nr:hypothetical protein [Mycobacterium pinniadriaticum]MCX2930922.1 hypothetical protein [Mycobacterium pinniadriaticum]MCX2937346.1 hypothetical protein [Mycobacterium pinniadriaticum]
METTAADDTEAAAGAVTRRPEVANPDAAATAGESGESPPPTGVRPTADSNRAAARTGEGVAGALTALARATEAAAGAVTVLELAVLETVRVLTLVDVRGEWALGLGFADDGEPVPADLLADELGVDEPESPEPPVSAHAAPAPARIATPTPRPTARPPRRPTYAEALFVGPITSPLVGSVPATDSIANPPACVLMRMRSVF